MLTYQLLRLLKFVGVILFGGGALASLLASSDAARKRAVHRVASPGLLLTWLAGYGLTLQLGRHLSEAWIVAGLVCSFVGQLSLVHLASRGRTSVTTALTLGALVLTLALMVFRPSWSSFLP